MQKNYNLLLAAAVGCALSAHAWALTPADGQPDLALYIPGSQANDPAFGFLVNEQTVANAVCLTNAVTNGGTTGDTLTTTHIYFQGGTNNNYSAIYCYTNDQKIPGLTSGDPSNNHLTKLWISRRRLGASFVGLDAVNHGTLLTYLKDPVTANCSVADTYLSSGGANYDYNYNCTTVTGSIAATAATSDVTPDVFYAADNVTPGSTPINASQINTIHALAGHIIGTPVTLALRNALQYAEIQSGLLPSACTVGNETAACVPTLTKEQLASIFSGAITDWTQFQITATQTLADVTAAGVTAGVSGLANPRDTTVHVCRRENGAGQQVAMLANILQYPCLGSAAPEIATPTSAPLGDIEYATSLGAVDSCLGDFNDGTNNWFGTTNPSPYPNPPATTVAHGNQWAISIQSTERNASNKAHYRFIAIDGAIPTGQEAYLGHYRLVGNYALSWNSGSNSASQNAALNAIAAYSKLPSTIASRNGTLSLQSFGQAGYIALSDNGFTPPLVWTPSNPVSPFSRVDSSGHPNACVVPTANLNYGSIQLQ